MFSDQVAELSLNAPSKCLDAVHADRTTCRFVASTVERNINHETTSGSKWDNRLSVIRFHSEMNEFGIDGDLQIPFSNGIVNQVVTAPHDAGLVLTTMCNNSNTVQLWRIPGGVVTCEDDLEYKPQEGGEEEDQQTVTTTPSKDEQSLEQVTSFEESNDEASSRLAHLVWRGQDEFDPGSIFTLTHSGVVSQWDVDHGASPVRSEQAGKGKEMVNTMIPPPRLACDPHNSQSLCVTSQKDIHILDWRSDTSLPTGTVSNISNAHKIGGVTCVDYNPNKPHVLASSGQDGLIKFWDLRGSTKAPLLMVGRGGHSHWISSVKYNPFHDQLVVSTGTDSMVNLWRMSSISSAPLLQLPGEASSAETNHHGDANNIRVASYEHSDSVYNVAWGAADAWIYVTVGHDGKVVLNHVPSDEKYKILL